MLLFHDNGILNVKLLRVSSSDIIENCIVSFLLWAANDARIDKIIPSAEDSIRQDPVSGLRGSALSVQ